MRLRDTTLLWDQLVCIRQHDIAAEFSTWREKTLPNLIKETSGLLSYLSKDTSPIVRCNRMLNWQCCFENARPLYLGCTGGVLACTSTFADGAHVFGDFDHEIARLIIDADWDRAQSADKNLGPIVAKRFNQMRGGMQAFAGRMCRAVAGPVLRNCAKNGGSTAVAEINDICRHDMVLLNSRSLSGCHGETAVHMAAAAGNVNVLMALL
jgi:hypothetical protein